MGVSGGVCTSGGPAPLSCIIFKSLFGINLKKYKFYILVCNCLVSAEGLDCIISKGERPSLMNLLNAQKWDLKGVIGELRESLLHIACRHGQLDIVCTLIEIYGCFRLDVRDKFGSTPCHVACENGHLEIMEYFYQCPYSLYFSFTNFHGETWLHSASKSEGNSVQLIRFITFNQIIIGSKGLPKQVEFNDDILWFHFYKSGFLKLNTNFDEIFVPDCNGYTPLHVACKQNNLKVIELFLFELSQILSFDFLQFIPSVLTLACELKKDDVINCLSRYLNARLLPCPNMSLSVSWSTFTLPNKLLRYPNETALFFAARRGDHELFKILFESISLFGVTNDYGDTILHAACVSCDFDMVTSAYKECIQRSVDVKAKNNMGNTCLHIACRWGSLKVVKYLVEKQFSIDDCNVQLETPLHLAIRNKRKSVFDFLLERDANLNVANILGETPLHIATCYPESFYYVKRLIDQSNCNSINEKDKYGDTPIFNACRTKNKEMVWHLLDNSSCDPLVINPLKHETVASIACRFFWKDLLEKVLSEAEVYPNKLQNYLGQTLIHTACWKDDLDTMNYLAKSCKSYDISEDINLLDNIFELTPLQFACKENDEMLFHKLLESHGCFPDTKNKEGNTVLHICSKFNLKDMAKICIEYCSTTVRNEQGNTPLHLACYGNNFELLDLLIKSLPRDRKIDDCKNKEGKNVLHVIAAQEGTLNILKQMVDSGRHDLYYVDRRGNTALHFAFQKGIVENAKYLLQIAYKDECWFNKEGKSPLSLAVDEEKYEFVKSIVKNCQENMLLNCCKIIKPNSKYFPQAVHYVQMPLIFYLFYLISANGPDDKSRLSSAQLKKYCSIVDLIIDLVGNTGIDPIHSELRDSQENTILHYISMCNYNEKLDKIADLALNFVDISCINKSSSAPLHYACSSPQHWMIWKLFEHKKGNAFKSLSINSFAGTPFAVSNNDQYNQQNLLYYLVAQGAKDEYTVLRSYCNSVEGKQFSIGIFVLGNSSVGKTTLIDTLRMMITDNRVSQVIKQPTTGLKRDEYIYYKNNHRYIFYDFAGQVEFETSHSVHLESLMSSNNRKHPFVFLLLVKGTDSLESNKKQINRWISFVRGHVRMSATTVHILLVCSVVMMTALKVLMKKGKKKLSLRNI